ncbi:hypothetical protein [Emticicia sp. C21]|uniref:hypothetical protein n=1 Tax=Emticicia sp. C21 TaxID=2302915 RepID=UPI000E34A3B0|nr:hypothetical protein [Emticicia sp. C21]RFS13484.1 hypothetical protein D0T08_26565 [Emticicia sp. C21]
MNLLPDEKVILESDTKEVILTSHRIWQKVSTYSSTEIKSIMLENISSYQAYRQSNIIVIIVGLFIGLVSMAGLIVGGTTERFLSLIFILFVASYYVWSKKRKIEISSPSANIVMDVDNMTQKARKQFMETLENARHKRLLMLAK